MKFLNSMLLLAFYFFLSACSEGPNYDGKAYQSPPSDSHLLEAFEASFQETIGQFQQETSSEEIAALIFASQMDLQTSLSEADSLLEDTGRCVLRASEDLQGVSANAELKRSDSGLVYYSDLLRKSDACLSFFKARFGDAWAKNSGRVAVSFFSYTL